MLDSLIILSDPNGEIDDNALEIDVHMQSYDKDGYKEPDWGSITKVGQFEDANILIQNSMIGSAGFTGVHVSSYDGITFKNNDFVDTAYFEPFYLKNFVPGLPKVKGLE